jgi:hypothetical protein
VMDDLLPWFRAVLDEEERLALDAGGSGPAGRWMEGEPLGAAVGTESGGTVVFENSPPTLGQQRHIAEHDPARVLCEVKAKRLLLDLFERQHHHLPPVPGAKTLRNRVEDRGACRTCITAKILALPYSDRPGYREEWRP